MPDQKEENILNGESANLYSSCDLYVRMSWDDTLSLCALSYLCHERLDHGMFKSASNLDISGFYIPRTANITIK